MAARPDRLSAPRRRLEAAVEAFDAAFFAPRDLRLCAFLRIGYAVLLSINVGILAPDVLLWFGESGVLPLETSRELISPWSLTLFMWLPAGDATVKIAFALLIAHIVLLGAGWLWRVQAVCVYLWLISFQHRHIILFDGEDTVFRLIGLALIFLPAGNCWSVDAWLRRLRGRPYPRVGPAWALRLVQIQMSVIYASTAWEKASGSDWVNGTALYYVTRLDDLYGRFPLPDVLVESLPLIRLATWSVLTIELVLPVALWLPWTRRLALLLALGLHLGIDYAMNLFLFQWVMVLGLVSFLRSEDLSALARLFRGVGDRLGLRRAPVAAPAVEEPAARPLPDGT